MILLVLFFTYCWFSGKIRQLYQSYA